jgi:hypothetical protein
VNRLGQVGEPIDALDRHDLMVVLVMVACAAALISAVGYGLWSMHESDQFRSECQRASGFVTRTEDGRRICARLL